MTSGSGPSMGPWASPSLEKIAGWPDFSRAEYKRMRAIFNMQLRFQREGAFDCARDDEDAILLGIAGCRVTYVDEGSVMVSRASGALNFTVECRVTYVDTETVAVKCGTDASAPAAAAVAGPLTEGLVVIDGVRMSEGAARAVEAFRLEPSKDVRRVRAGLTHVDLVEELFKGKDGELGDAGQAALDWLEYTDAIVAAATRGEGEEGRRD